MRQGKGEPPSAHLQVSNLALQTFDGQLMACVLGLGGLSHLV